MIMKLRTRPWFTAVAVLLALALLVLGACNPDDSGPGSYDSGGGNTFWYPKPDRR